MGANRLSTHDTDLCRYQYPLLAHDKQVAATATATIAAQGVDWTVRLVKVDASFSDSTASALMTIKSGSTTIDEKFVHGSGAIDYADWGFEALNPNEAMSATLASGGVGITGTITISGFKTPIVR